MATVECKSSKVVMGSGRAVAVGRRRWTCDLVGVRGWAICVYNRLADEPGKSSLTGKVMGGRAPPCISSEGSSTSPCAYSSGSVVLHLPPFESPDLMTVAGSLHPTARPGFELIDG